MRILIPAVLLAAALAVASPAAAQTTGSSSSTQKAPSKPAKPKKPPVPRKPIGARAFFIVDTEMMTASQSFKAVTGSSTMFGYGGGGEILNVWKSIFARVAVSVASKSGERGTVADGEFIPAGFPVDLGLSTIELGGGWRTYMKKHPNVALYAGGGLLLVGYSEKSPLAANDTENVSERFTGYSAQGGLEFKLSKWLTAAAEAQYRMVPNALGDAGVSKAYNETGLGGFAIRGMVGIRFKK